MPPVRVVIVDDSEIVRFGLREALTQASGLEIVGETGTGHEAVGLVEALQPDVVLLDVELPDVSGIEVAQRLQNHDSSIPILALSAHDDPQYVRGLLDAGAAGYLLKDEPTQVILEALHAVAAGEKGWFSQRLRGHMISWFGSGPDELTNREAEVLHLLAEGKTNREMAHELGITVKTIEKHLDAVYTKLGVGSRVEAVVVAVRDGLVTLDDVQRRGLTHEA